MARRNNTSKGMHANYSGIIPHGPISIAEASFQNNSKASQSESSEGNVTDVRTVDPLENDKDVSNKERAPVPVSLKATASQQKYIQYFSQGGWGNQIMCLKGAYNLALASNRTLILSPILPHKAYHLRDVFDQERQAFKLKYSLRKAFLEKLKSAMYIPLHHVLDLDESLPGLLGSTVDFREFYESTTTNVSGLSTWTMESSFSHFNTQWIWNRTELEGTHEEIMRREHNHDRIYNRTFRDIVQISQESPYHDYDVWTLLDSFRISYHQSIYKIPTTTMESTSQPQNAFLPRFEEIIRRTSTIVRRDRWKSISYAAVHIRGSDGPFKRPENIAKAIEDGISDIIEIMEHWASRNLPPDPSKRMLEEFSPLPTNKTTKQEFGLVRNQPSHFSPSAPLGLFVATDIRNLGQHQKFIAETRKLGEIMGKKFGSTVQVWMSQDLASEVQALRLEEQSLGYPSIFLDQQLAACANIGFAGTSGSTFSAFIRLLRKDNFSEVCSL